MAVECGNTDIIKCLLRAGAKVNIWNFKWISRFGSFRIETEYKLDKKGNARNWRNVLLCVANLQSLERLPMARNLLTQVKVLRIQPPRPRLASVEPGLITINVSRTCRASTGI